MLTAHQCELDKVKINITLNPVSIRLVWHGTRDWLLSDDIVNLLLQE